jgi:integrase
MRGKKGARGQVWYYLDKGKQPNGKREWVPLGNSFPDALRAYAEQVETVQGPAVTVPELLTRWSTATAVGRKAGIRGVRSLSLIVNEKGEALGKAALRYRFDKARELAADAAPNKATAARLRAIQFRDLRAKAASDVDALDQAQKLLGHTKRDMTEHYVRKKRGEKVSPVR